MLYGDQSGKIRENTEKSLRLAARLFPDEAWICKDARIYVAQSRLIEEQREKNKWEREMSQVRILTGRGSVACFLPENRNNGETAQLCADLVLDGFVMELKTVSGTRTTLGTAFRFAYKQGAVLLSGYSDLHEHSVFIRLFSDLSIESVKAKIAGELKGRSDPGIFFLFF
jgi:hypothetical protein